MADGKKYAYDFKYDSKKEEFIYEKFIDISKDQYGNEKETVWLLSDSRKEEYSCVDEEMLQMILMVGRNRLLCYMVDASK